MKFFKDDKECGLTKKNARDHEKVENVILSRASLCVSTESSHIKQRRT